MTDTVTPTPTPTRTVTLHTGYTDTQGTLHRDVVIRPPTADDEIKADAELTALRLSDDRQVRLQAQSETLQVLHLVRICTVSFGTILQPGIEIYRSLTRKDAQMLVNKFYKFEDEEHAERDPEKKDEEKKDGTEGNS